MKKNLLLIAFLTITGAGSVIAQPEIIVEPGYNTLSNAVEAHPGSTLILHRGGSYVIDRELLLATPTIIKGEREPAENSPPVFMPIPQVPPETAFLPFQPAVFSGMSV
jgi:hypothetical protein